MKKKEQPDEREMQEPEGKQSKRSQQKQGKQADRSAKAPDRRKADGRERDGSSRVQQVKPALGYQGKCVLNPTGEARRTKLA